MAKTHSSRDTVDVRRFRRAAEQRLKEAQFLCEHGYTTAAVYLSAYGVECALKALLLSSEPVKQQTETLKSFRGTKAHDFRWLQQQLEQRGVYPSRQTLLHLGRVAGWTTGLRYDPSATNTETAQDFLQAATEIVARAKGRW